MFVNQVEAGIVEGSSDVSPLQEITRCRCQDAFGARRSVDKFTQEIGQLGPAGHVPVDADPTEASNRRTRSAEGKVHVARRTAGATR